jgi:hypothetical protein
MEVAFRGGWSSFVFEPPNPPLKDGEDSNIEGGGGVDIDPDDGMAADDAAVAVAPTRSLVADPPGEYVGLVVAAVAPDASLPTTKAGAHAAVGRLFLVLVARAGLVTGIGLLLLFLTMM